MKDPLRRRPNQFITKYTPHGSSVYNGQRHVCSSATPLQARQIADALNIVYKKGL